MRRRGIAEGACDWTATSLTSVAYAAATASPKVPVIADGNVLDECGVCGGDGIARCLRLRRQRLDECGVCGGDGIAEGACDWTATSLTSVAYAAATASPKVPVIGRQRS